LELNQYPFKLSKPLRGRVKPLRSDSVKPQPRGKFKLPITNSGSGRRSLSKLRGKVKPQPIANSSSGGGSQLEINKVRGKTEFIISRSST
jgi:hypothetical protein